MQHPTPRPTGLGRSVLTTALALCAAATTAEAQSVEMSTDRPPADEVVVRIERGDSFVKIIERFAKVLRLDARIARVDGFDPEIVEVTAIDARSVRVLAIAPGVTTLTLTDENDEISSVRVFVEGDVRHLQEYISRLFPNSSVEAVEINDAVLLRGWVTEPAQITQIVQVAERFYATVIDQMNVGSVQQVMLKCKIMEVQRSKLEKLGLNFIVDGDSPGFTSQPGTLSTAQAVTAPSFEATFSDELQLLFSMTSGERVFDAFIEALKGEQLLKILAEPNLVTMNGRPSHLLAGGEFPILIPNGLGTTGIEYREFGVRLETVPIVLGHDRVRILVNAEVSDRDFTNSVLINGTSVPALTTRRANTQVELGFGETLMIAGLISNTHTATTSKIPYLGDLPYVGSLFSRKEYEEGETELIVLITPELVAPMRPGQVPAVGPGLNTDPPTTRELFNYNMIEVPSYGGRYGDVGSEPGGIATAPGISAPPAPARRGFPTGPAAPMTEFRVPAAPPRGPLPTPAPALPAGPAPTAPIEIESLPPVAAPPPESLREEIPPGLPAAAAPALRKSRLPGLIGPPR